jgi:hypothetical protein
MIDNFSGYSQGAVGPFQPNANAGAAALYGQAAGASYMGAAGMAVQAGMSFLMAGVEKAQAKNRANQIKLQAEQRSNQLMQSFNKAIGSAQYGAARRGVKAGEGSVMRNIELSAKDLGADLDISRKNARAQAGAMRAQASMNYTNSMIGAGMTGYSAYKLKKQGGLLNDIKDRLLKSGIANKDMRAL